MGAVNKEDVIHLVDEFTHIGGDELGPMRESGRLMVVGGDPELEAVLARVWPGETIRPVRSYLMALGEIGVAGSPAVIIGGTDPPPGSGDITSIAQALRRLAPRSKLILVVDPQEREVGIEALRAGYDQYLMRPVNPVALAEALGIGHGDHEDTGEKSKASSVTRPRGRGLESEVANELPARVESMTGEKNVEQRSRMEVGDQSIGDEDLGDVDLLDELMNRHAGMSAMALRLIRSRSGLGGVGLIETSEMSKAVGCVPAGHVSVAVEHHGKLLGMLHAAGPVKQLDLAPWAGWLGHWLGLQKRWAGMWEMAFKDDLTGAWNRRYFNRFLEKILDRAVSERFRVTLMIFDIDDFKRFNDRYGHLAGDEILRETTRLMQSVQRGHDVVARIGGDEFAVIFWDAQGPRRPNSQHPIDVRKATERFQKEIRSHKFPKLLDQTRGTLTISGGLAGFPWDGRTPQELMEKADAMAMQSKRQGKNVLTFGPGALQEGPARM